MSPYIKNFSLNRHNSLFLSKKNVAGFVLKNPFILNIILLGLIFITLILYLIQMNQIVSLGFKLNELEKKKDELEKINKSLLLEKIKLESSETIQKNLTSFIKTEKVDYLRPLFETAVSKK